MTRHRIAQIGENRNPKSPENRLQTRRFLQIRLLQLRRSATPFNGLAVLHGRLERAPLNKAGLFAVAALAVLIVLTGAKNLDAQSFNCRYAHHRDERLICKDPTLATLDEQLASVYRRLILRLPRGEGERL